VFILFIFFSFFIKNRAVIYTIRADFFEEFCDFSVLFLALFLVFFNLILDAILAIRTNFYSEICLFSITILVN